MEIIVINNSFISPSPHQSKNTLYTSIRIHNYLAISYLHGAVLEILNFLRPSSNISNFLSGNPRKPSGASGPNDPSRVGQKLSAVRRRRDNGASVSRDKRAVSRRRRREKPTETPWTHTRARARAPRPQRPSRARTGRLRRATTEIARRRLDGGQVPHVPASSRFRGGD